MRTGTLLAPDERGTRAAARVALDEPLPFDYVSEEEASTNGQREQPDDREDRDGRDDDMPDSYLHNDQIISHSALL